MLTGLSMMAIKGHCKDRRGENVEDDDVDIRVSFDEREHGYPLLAGVASSSPRVSL